MAPLTPFLQNLKKKNHIKIRQKINALYLKVWNYQFQPAWASSFKWRGHQNGSTGAKVITQKHKKNTIFKSFGPLVSKRVWEELPFSIPDFILYVVRIIVLKFHGNRSTGTKVIVRKPMCLQTDNRIIYDRKLFPTYRPRFCSACNQNHTYYFVWPKTLIRYEIYILSYRSSFFFAKVNCPTNPDFFQHAMEP